MAQKIPLMELPGWPAALNQQLAAAYCGVSVDTFASVCPVQPIAITKSRHGSRYLRVRLDEWLMSLDGNLPPKRKSMGDLWRENSDRGSTE